MISQIAKGLLFFILIFAVVADGGVDLTVKSILAVLASFLSLVEFRRSVSSKAKFSATVAVAIVFVLIAAILVQSLRFPNPFQNPIWSSVRSVYPSMVGSISLAPEQSFSAIVTLAPILVFIGCLKIIERKSEAVRMLRLLAYLTTGAAIWGLLGYLQILDLLGLPPREFYQDSLTSFFVNRNTAGTFFGLGTLTCLSLCRFGNELNRHSIARIFQAIINGRSDFSQLPVGYLSCAIINIVALALTQSRGAYAATGTALAVYFYLMSRQNVRGNVSLQPHRIGRAVLRRAVTSLVALTLVGFLGGRAIYRQETAGIDQQRVCTYQATLKMAFDNWPVGIGFGTFSNSFPTYRNPECSGIFGTWEMAHNFYLEGLAGLGVIFCLATIVAYVTLIWSFIIGMKGGSKSLNISVLGVSALILITLHSMVDFSLQIPGVANFAAALLGICVAASFSSRPYFDRRATPGNQRHSSLAQRDRYLTDFQNIGVLQQTTSCHDYEAGSFKKLGHQAIGGAS